jgi:hypothetical protein
MTSVGVQLLRPRRYSCTMDTVPENKLTDSPNQ